MKLLGSFSRSCQIYPLIARECHVVKNVRKSILLLILSISHHPELYGWLVSMRRMRRGCNFGILVPRSMWPKYSPFRALLSVRITGSMTVERVAKPLKNRVLTKERAKMSSEKSALLLRVGLNLRFMQTF